MQKWLTQNPEGPTTANTFARLVIPSSNTRRYNQYSHLAKGHKFITSISFWTQVLYLCLSLTWAQTSQTNYITSIKFQFFMSLECLYFWEENENNSDIVLYIKVILLVFYFTTNFRNMLNNKRVADLLNVFNTCPWFPPKKLLQLLYSCFHHFYASGK